MGPTRIEIRSVDASRLTEVPPAVSLVVRASESSGSNDMQGVEVWALTLRLDAKDFLLGAEALARVIDANVWEWWHTRSNPCVVHARRI